MKTNQLLGLGLLGAAGWLYFRNRSTAAAAATPTNAFGAPLNATKPAVFGFNTSRLNPTGTRQATNATANGGQTGIQTAVDLSKLLASLGSSVAGWFKRDPELNPKAGNPSTLGRSVAGTPYSEDPIYPVSITSGSAFDAEIARFDASQAVNDNSLDAGDAFQADVVRDFGID